MIIPNPSGGYETTHRHAEGFESNNKRESVDAMEAPPMKGEQQHTRRLKSKASRRRNLTEIFNLDVVGEEKLSPIVSPSEKPVKLSI